MTTRARRTLGAACAAAITWLIAASAAAQVVGSREAPRFEDSMSSGLVPLFGFVAAGMVVMALATLITAFVLRPRLPRLGS